MKSFQSKVLFCLLALTGLLQKPSFSQIAEGSIAPTFQAKIIGSSLDFIFSGDLQKPVVIFFWDISDEEIQDLKSLDSFAQRNSVTFQTISVFFGNETDVEKVESILHDNSISLAALLTNTELEEQYKVDQTPTLFVINTKNQVVLSKTGIRLTPQVFDLITDSYLGGLTVYCNQNGAGVYLNGGYFGMISDGSLRIPNLKTGTYQLQVRKDEYTTFYQAISIASGQNTTVNAYLNSISPPKGSLTITCNQNGAEVYLNDIRQGRIYLGSLTITNLNSATYHLKVQGTGQDGIFSQYIEIESGQNKAVNVTFIPKQPAPPRRPITPPSAWKQKKTIGSYIGFFAGYTIPMDNLKDTFNDQQPVNLGARIRLMSKKALAWEFSGNYYQFKNNNNTYQLTQKIIPITLNMSVGAKYFYLTGGGGYYFTRYTFESSFSGKVAGKLDRWGLNTGVGIGFGFFEIGARYHYMLKDSKNNASPLNFIDVYGGITVSLRSSE